MGGKYFNEFLRNTVRERGLTNLAQQRDTWRSAVGTVMDKVSSFHCGVVEAFSLCGNLTGVSWYLVTFDVP
jgi:hypothetical protein